MTLSDKHIKHPFNLYFRSKSKTLCYQPSVSLTSLCSYGKATLRGDAALEQVVISNKLISHTKEGNEMRFLSDRLNQQ